MDKLTDTIQKITSLDESAMKSARLRWDSIAKPLNSLGLLEKDLVRIAGITGSSQIELSPRAVVVMCADNGVVSQGVTQTGSDVTAVVTENMGKGISAVCIMARAAGADVFPVDIGVKRDLSGMGVLNRKIAYGTRDITQGPAMTREQAIAALEVGIDIAGDLADKGFRLLATGEMGIGNTTTSCAVTSVLLGCDPDEIVGRGAGLSSEGLLRKRAAVKTAIQRNSPDPSDPVDVLSKVGGFDLAGLAGVFLGGAAKKIPVLVDGVISAAAALLAVRLCPAAEHCLIGSHMSKEPAMKKLVEELHLHPILQAEMCLGEGTGAVAVLPVLDMAADVYRGMSTFQEIEIEEYRPQH